MWKFKHILKGLFLLFFLPIVIHASVINNSLSYKNNIKTYEENIVTDSLGIIKGAVYNKKIKTQVTGVADIKLFSSSGRLIRDFKTDNLGEFKTEVTKGDYIIEIKVKGYRKFRGKFQVENFDEKSVFIAYVTPLELQKEFSDGEEEAEEEIDDSVLMGNIVITAEKAKIIIKGDTIQYDATQYNVRKGALLQELIKKIPGLNIDKNGVVMANGQPVQKILIDGKEFFNNDIKLALTNLPSDMVDKIELYKESSDLSKITGIIDGEESQVLNLKVKEEYKNSLFGNALAGYGDYKRYNYKGMFNYLGNTTQISLLGDADNTNGSLDEVESFSEDDEGITISKTIGLNATYEKKSDLKIESNILYTEESNHLKSVEEIKYFLSDEDRTSSSQLSNKKDQNNTSFGINLSKEPKNSKFSMYFRLTGNHEGKKEKEFTEQQTFSNLSNTIREISDSYTSEISNDLRSSLTMGLKLNDKGRALSLVLNGDYNKEDGKGWQKSLTNYEINSTEIDLDQRSKMKDLMTDFGATLSYTEPFDSKNSLQMSYSFQRMDINRYNKVFNKDEEGVYSILDSTYTRESDAYYNKHNINLTFQSVQDRYQYAVGVTAEPTESRNKIHIGDYTIQMMNQKVSNYTSFVRFQYNPKKNSFLKFNYFGNIIKPGFEQITSDTITISPTNKIYGNPDLRSTINNNFNFQYQKISPSSGKYFSVVSNINYVSNQVVSYTTIDALGNTGTTYKNIDGNWGLNLAGIYSTPIKDTDISLEFNVNGSYLRQLGFMNSVKNVTNDYNLSNMIALDFDPGFIQLNLTGFYQYKLTKNNQQGQSKLEISSWGITNLIQLELPFDIELQSYFSYLYDHGYNSNVEKEKMLWNMAIAKTILKDGKGEIKLQLYDILNKKNNIMRTINSNYISDVHSNMIKRYFLLSFAYRFGFAQ